jgi:flagellar biosynthesis protein FlhB
MMSAYNYLVFVIGVVLVAIYGSILTEFIDPMLAFTADRSTTAASATGQQWASQFFDFFALLSLLLLIFALIVAIVNRRRGVRT